MSSPGVLSIRRISISRIPILGLGLGLGIGIGIGLWLVLGLGLGSGLGFRDSGYGDLEFGDLKFGELKFGEMKFGEMKRKLYNRSPSGDRGGSPENFEFGAFWDIKIASEQCKMMFFVN